MIDDNKSSLINRTLRNLRHVWQGIAGFEYDESSASLHPDLPEKDSERLLKQMHACLETRGGEVSARARAAALGRAYLALNKSGKMKYLRVLAENFGVDHKAVDDNIDALQQTKDPVSRSIAEQNLRRTLEAPRLKLLTQFNALPEGVKFLVDMRADLLEAIEFDKSLRGLEHDLKGLLKTWFDVDFLELRQISWDTCSASVLEKLIAYEAVHAIESWYDLKNRLGSDRRCFAYFHPRMPDEPLIFVEVALVDGLSTNVQVLLDENAPVIDPKKADTAIFYSISNAQKGLAGISFGNFLIKLVVKSLSSEFKELKTYATLSPMPGFKTWLDQNLGFKEKKSSDFHEMSFFKELSDSEIVSVNELKILLDTPVWLEQPHKLELFQSVLTRLATSYLTSEKRKKGDLRALDPVAHFHLSNGASLKRLNWMGDTSVKGLRQSLGFMVNYLYEIGNLETNHEAYKSEGKFAVSSSLRGLF